MLPPEREHPGGSGRLGSHSLHVSYTRTWMRALGPCPLFPLIVDYPRFMGDEIAKSFYPWKQGAAERSPPPFHRCIFSVPLGPQGMLNPGSSNPSSSLEALTAGTHAGGHNLQYHLRGCFLLDVRRVPEKATAPVLPLGGSLVL